MKLKLSFGLYKQVHAMAPNEFNRWAINFYEAAYANGLNDGESELDDADATQWQEFIRNTPGAGKVMKTYSTDDIYEMMLTVSGIGKKLAAKVANKFEEEFDND